MSRRDREPVETTSYLAMLRRMIVAGGRRVADADPEDLADLLALRDVLDQAIVDAVRGQVEDYGRSWTEVGRGLGITKQAAQQRFGRKNLSPTGA